MTISELLDILWRDYVAVTPQAERIRHLLAERGETVAIDHIAIRTLGAPGPGLAAIARPFESLGWTVRDHYRCDDLHLVARYWQHDDPALPKLLVSELILSELSAGARALIEPLIAQLPPGFHDRGDLAWAGRPWRISHAAYAALRAETEHAAWIAAFGFRVHHFTVAANRLATFPDLEALDAFLVEHGFTLDTRGGAIRGSRADRFEGSATRADAVDVVFSDAIVRIPSGHYELAWRYPLPSGQLFHGFPPALLAPAQPAVSAAK